MKTAPREVPTTIEPELLDAAQATATNDPAEATHGVVLVRPGIASVISSGGAAEVPAVPAWIARIATKSHVTVPDPFTIRILKPHPGAELERAGLAHCRHLSECR